MVEILRQETDEAHPVSTEDLRKRLLDKGITCDRRTLYKDIELLNSSGYEVMCIKHGNKNFYYVEDRSFSIPELRILMDATLAAGFVTPKKTRELVGKIAAMGGRHCAEMLKNGSVCFNTRKHANESIYYNIDFIEKAIGSGKKISFCYFDLDESGKCVHSSYL